MQNLTNKLRTLREVNGYKQDYVGNYLGLTQTGYSRIENGEVDLSVKYLQKLAELYKLTPEQLLGWDGKISIGNVSHNHNGVVFNHGTYNESPLEDRLKILESKLESLLNLFSKNV